MRYLSFSIYHFKPLLHQHTEQLDISELPKIVIVQGENGSGKSSLLRELSPLPATKTDYLKDGYKRLELEHQGKRYTIASDFSQTNYHSFQCEQVELNTGGTAEIQEQLCLQHFGFTPLLYRLTRLQYRYTELTKSQRKELFLQTYPGSLEFIIDYYKRVSSIRRASQQQLKLMLEREAQLQAELCSEELYQQYCQQEQLHLELDKALAQDLYRAQTELQQLQQQLTACGWAQRSLPSLTELQQERQRVQSWNRQRYQLPESLTELDQQLLQSSAAVSETQTQVTSLLQQNNQLVSELDQYRSLLNDSLDAKLQQQQAHQQLMQQQLAALKFNDSIPILPDWPSYQRQHQQLTELLLSLQGQDLTLLVSATEYRQLQQRQQQLLMEQRQLLTEQQQQSQQLDKISRQLQERQQRFQIPDGCQLSCRLKQTVQQLCQQQEQECQQLRTQLQSSDLRLTQLHTELDRLTEQLTLNDHCQTTLQQLQALATGPWTDYLLSGHGLLERLRTDLSGLLSSWRLLATINQRWQDKLQLEQELQLTATNISNLEQLLVTKQQFALVVQQKQQQQQLLLQQLETQQRQLTDRQQTHQTLTAAKRWQQEGEQLRQHWQQLQQGIRLRGQYELWQERQRLWQQCRQRNLDYLLTLKQQRKQQEQLRLRLDQEIRPTKDRLEKKINKYQLVENELSPTTGIPYRYTVRYLNALYQLTNRYLGQIWDYPFRLCYNDETASGFDYLLPLEINEESQLKDISLCSKGQKSIVDLTLNWAVLKYGQLLGHYPVQLDEIDEGLSPNHKSRLLTFLSEQAHGDEVCQFFLISHDSVTCGGFEDAGVICLSNDQEVVGRVISERK